MSKCEGVTHVKITGDMMDRYPGLKEKRLDVGDVIKLGEAPFDGRVAGPRKFAGECENSCTIIFPVIDGNDPLSWESNFVQEFFPNELKRLEDVEGSPEVQKCYTDPMRDFTTKQFYTALSESGDFNKDTGAILSRFEEGRESIEDLKFMEKMLKGRVDKLKKGEDVSQDMLALKLIKLDIRKRTSEAADK